MGGVIAKHETFNYSDPPFHFIETPTNSSTEFTRSPHWHEDLEIYYCLMGHSRHFINGECYVGAPGRVIITNSEFVHNVLPDPAMKDVKGIAGLRIIIEKKFLDDVFPQYNDIYFTNDREKASDEVTECIEKIRDFLKSGSEGDYDNLYIKGLVLELLYYLCEEGTVLRTEVDRTDSMKDIERIKEIIQFVESDYSRPVTQSEAAERFHFSPTYFARYFKKYTGMTFMDFLTDFRLEKARIALVHGDETVYQIAMETGFTDDRRLIIAFKKKYGVTPLQYRKQRKG